MTSNRDDEVQEINIFLDDSGTLSPKVREEYFIYAGYVFIGSSERHQAHMRFRSVSDGIRLSLGVRGELKASTLSFPHRNTLVRAMNRYESMTCAVRMADLQDRVMGAPASRHRYKDYIVKVGVKRKLQDMINRGLVNPELHTNVNVYIDEQHTASDGLYNLEDSMREELVKGTVNREYGVFHRPIFSSADVKVRFCDSSGNYLIQASDLLANRINHSFNKTKPELRRMAKLHVVTFP